MRNWSGSRFYFCFPTQQPSNPSPKNKFIWGTNLDVATGANNDVIIAPAGDNVIDAGDGRNKVTTGRATMPWCPATAAMSSQPVVVTIR